MKNFALLTFVCGMLLPLTLHAQDNKKPAEPSADEQAQMEAWMKYASPGEPHKQLQRLVGEWTTVMRSSYDNPDQAEVTKGTAKFESLLGDRFIQQTYTGTSYGMPFHGVGMQGYDNFKKKYVGTWMDSFGTGIMHTEGTYDPKTHTMTETSTTSSPAGPMKMKLVTEYKDNDHFTFTMYMIVGDEEMKSLVIEYTRKK